MESRTETVWGFCILLAICSGTVQSACNEGAISGHTVSSSSQSSSNPVTDVFKDSGWCAATDKPNEWVDISFPAGFGAKQFTIGSTTVDKASYPSSVLVKYEPIGASDLQHFPLKNGQPLVILLNNTGTSTMNLGTGIAVQRLRFLLQSYTGRACMKLAVLGCDIKDLCSPPCVNGGRCLAENQCLCANGFNGDSCETKPCNAAPLGIFDGRVPQKDITVSSEDPNYPKAQIGYNTSSPTSNKGWCASDNDPAPWVQVKFDKPKSISTLYFFYINGPNQLHTFMRRFELQYIAPTDSSRTFRTFADNIDSLNGTTAIYVTMFPPVITDTIRIVSQAVEKKACFKLEMAGCDPSSLCQAGWCLNGGSCVGLNICKCPDGFLGNRCDQTKTDINTPVISFVNITQNILVTTTFTFSVTGSVSITQVNSTNVLVINGANSNIKIDKDTPGAECLNNIDNCQTGFTLSLDVNFGSLVDGTYIVSSGGDIAGHKGLALYYNQQSLTYIVTTANQIWSLTVHYVPILNVWQKFEITWNTNLGIGLFLNGNLLGTHGRPEPTTATQTAGLCIGCNPGQTSTVVVNMQILQIHTWTVSRTELVNAGIVVAPVVTTRRPVQTTPTTSQPTSTKKTTTGPTVATTTTKTTTPDLGYQIYNMTIIGIVNSLLITPTFNFTVHGNPQLELENGNQTALVLDCSQDQYVELTDQGIPCLQDLNSCANGFTFNLEVKFTAIELQEKTYILSSGGDDSRYNGMALYLHSNLLTYGVKKGAYHWAAIANIKSIIQLNHWHKLEISWQEDKGILVLIDGFVVINEAEWTPAPYTPGDNPVLIGKSPLNNYTSCMKVRNLFTWTTQREVLVDSGIVSGHKTPMITTTAQTGLLNMTPYDLTFISIDDVTQLVYTNDFMFQGHGHLSLPPQGDSILTLRSAADQYLTLLNRSVVCLDLIDGCKYGFTIEISVLVFQVTDKLYMFTNIDNDTTSGVYLYYQNRQVYYGFRYGGKVWSGSVRYNIMDFLWHSFMLSWSNTDGITLLEHYTPISQSAEPSLDTSGASQTTIGNLQIGKGYDIGTNMDLFQVNNLKIWPYSIRYLIDNQIYTIHTTAMSTKPSTKLPTTVTLTTSISSISFAYWTFLEQVGQVIKTSMYDLTTHGSVQLVRNESGDALIQVNVSNGGYLEINGTPLPCLTDVQRCGGGLSVSLDIWFLTINQAEILYLVSKPTTQAGLGIYLYYVNSIINVDVIQPELKQKWSTNFHFQIDLKKWYSIELNWSLNTGISLFINGILIKTESRYTSLTQVDIPAMSHGLTLGSALNNNLQVIFYIKSFGIGPSQVKDMTSVQPQLATDNVSHSVTNGHVAQVSTNVVTSTPQPSSTSNIPTSSTKKILTTSHSVPNTIQPSTQPSTVKEQIAFVNITANTLYTSHQTFTLHGNPVVVKTESGESAIQLNASSGSFIKMDNIKNVTCFGSGNNCDKGVTVGVYLSLVNIKRNESWYILSYKSNMSSEISFYTYYLNNEVYFGSKIANLTWSANVNFNIAFNTFHKIELSISQSMGGIGLLIDGKLVKFVTKETSTNHFPDIQTTGLVIGQTTKTDTTTTVLIGGIQFLPKVSEILVDSLPVPGVTTGKHTAPPSESTRHYSSTQTPSRYPESTFQPSSTTLISELTSNLPTSATSAPNTAINMAQTTNNQPTTSTESNVVSTVSQQTSTNSVSPTINIVSSTVIHTSQNSHLHSNMTTKSIVDTTTTQQSSSIVSQGTQRHTNETITTTETISYLTTSQQTQANVDTTITQQSSTKDGTPNTSPASSIVSQGTQRHTNDPITTTETISYSTTSRQTPLKSLPTTSDIQNLTTQFPISMGHIAFINITANTLYTSHNTFTLHGNPVVVKTASGENAIKLNASSGSFIKMDNIKNITCFGSGETCDQGVTVGVSLSLVNIKPNESLYILSYKSNMSSGISFYTYYLNKKLYFGTKIANLTWSANVNFNIAFNTFHKIELSISQAMGGIGLLIDGKLVKYVTKETSTNHFPDIQTTGLVIGQTTKTDTTTTVLIGGIKFLPKVSEILVDSLPVPGVTTGKHTAPPSESTRHYSSTQTPSRYPGSTFQPSSTSLISAELTSNLPTSTTSTPNTAINMAQTTSNQPTTSTESNVVSTVSQHTSTNSVSPAINILSSTVIHTSQNSHLHSNMTTKSNVDTTITQQSSSIVSQGTQRHTNEPITTTETISYLTTSQQTQANVGTTITQQSSTKDGTPNTSTASSIVSQGTQRHTNEPITTTETISYSTTSRQTPLKIFPTTSEIQNLTTQFPISMGHIAFINITANTLYTSHNTFTLHGNPVIVKTASGENAIKLNASSGSFIKMDSIKNVTCLGSGDTCDQGVTVGVSLSLVNIKPSESLYILSYKSNMSSGISFYTYYLNKTFYFGTKKANLTWSANVNFNIAFNTFHKLELSISQSMGGIGLLIDGKLVKYVTKETSTNHFPDIQTTGLVIGQTTKTDTTTTVLIGGIQFLPKVSEILVDSLPVPGVTTGKHIAPPSESTRDYNSTQTPSRYPESTFQPSSTTLISELTSNLPTSTTSTPNTAINMAQTTSNQPTTSTESNVVSTVIQQTSSNSVAPTIHIAASTVYDLSKNPNGHSSNTTGSSVDATLFQQTSTKHWTPATSTASIISQGTQSNKPITSTEAISYSTTSQQTPTRSVSTSMPTVSEMQNQTTQFPLSIGHIAFINITTNTLYTSHNTFTLHGNPVVVKTESGESAIKLNASSGSFIKMDNTNVTCIGSGNNCGHGVTVGVSLKIVTIKQNESLYILSYRSNASASISFYVYYLNKMIHFGSKIANVTWSSNVSFNLVFNTIHTIELSISQALGGIGLLIDGKLVKYVTKETSTNQFPDIQTTGLVIGQTAKTDTTTTVLIGGIQFWPKISQVLVESFTVTRGVTKGKTTVTPPKTSPTTTTTTTTTTTVATTTATPIPTFQWNLTTIPTSNVIAGPDFNLTIHGTPTSTDAGVELNGTTQYIELGSLQCLLNPFKCAQGLSVQFTIDFKFVQENTFVLTSGGQLPNGIGIAVIYRYGKYQFIVSTATHSWYATCGKNVLKPNKFHVVMLSWHTTIGLELIVDNTQIELVTQPVTHEATLVTNTTVYFGKQPTDNIKFQYVIQTVSIWYAHVDILVSAGLCTKPERPEKPTTTVKPTPKPTTKVPPTAKPTASPTTKYTGTMTTKAPQCPVGCVAITSSPSKPPVSATSKPPIKTDVPTPQKPTTQKLTTQKPTTTPTPTTTPRTTPTTTERGAPNYNTVPTMTATVTGNTNQAYLACAFSRPTETGIEMTIALIINGNRVLLETVAGSAGIALFSVAQVNRNLYGVQIKCSLVANYVGSSHSTQVFESKPYVPTFTVTPAQITVTEGHSGKPVTVQSTAPPQLYCCTGCRGQCQVHVVGIFKYDRKDQRCNNNNYISQAVIESTKPPNYNKEICGFVLTVANWKNTNQILVVGTLDNRRDGTQRRELKIEVNVYNQPPTAQITISPVTHVLSTTVKVTILDNYHSTYTCKSINDPHMMTFDGAHFNNMREGQFVMFKHKELPFEVRTWYQKCSKRSHATCNCGVAVQSGDDVITVIGCNTVTSGGHHPGQGHGIGLILQQLFGSHGHAHGHHNDQEFAKTPMTIQIYKNGQLTPGTYIRRYGCGQKYEIELPTGMIVTVQQSYKPFINIWIKASSVDRDKSTGLCGNFNGRRDEWSGNKGLDRFISEHVAPNNPFFNGVGAAALITGSTYCSCVENKGSVCSLGLGVMQCSRSRHDITNALRQQAKAPVLATHRRKRQVQGTEIIATVAPDGFNLTESEMVEKCENYIMKSTVTQNCKPILTTNLTQQVENCVHDYNATESFAFATSALSDIVVDCVESANTILANNDTDADSNDTDVVIPIPDNLDDILANACVEECGDNGACQGGECECDDGFSGVTCNISSDTKPVVSIVPYLCDVSDTLDCKGAVVYGDNFVNSTKLTCHYEYIKVSEGVHVTQETGTIAAEFLGINQVMCQIPRLQSVNIRISNNGNTLSDSTSPHIVYDSRCYDCSIRNDTTYAPGCSRTDSNCEIAGQCYLSGWNKEGDACRVCNPAANDTEWSLNIEKTECTAQPLPVFVDNEDDRHKIIALAVVSAVLAAILLLLVVYIVKSRSSSKSKKEFGAYQVTSEPQLHRDEYIQNNPIYARDNEKL